MHNRVLLLIISIFIGLSAFSQHKISGLIIDEESGKPVSDAVVMKEDGQGVLTDSIGQFTITLDKLPAKLGVSHITYGQSEITVDKIPDGILVIRVQQMISRLDEVQITAEKMRILTEKDDFSLSHFAIDRRHMWMLGYINNRPRFGRLWLANHFGDTLRSIPVTTPMEFYNDVFGNVHLVSEDSVFQLFGTPDSIIFAGRLSREEFLRILGPIKAYYDDKLVYQKYLPYQEGLHTYYYSEDDSLPKFLSCTRDTTAEILQEDEFVYGRYAREMTKIMNETDYGQRLLAWQGMVNRKKLKHLRFYRNIITPMVASGDKLHIVNLYKDSLLTYSSSGKFIQSIHIDFHRNEALKSRDYMEFEFLHDPVTDKVFILERQNTAWLLSNFNTDTGKLTKIPLPDFPGMADITVFNNAVYFLYPEKKYPFYTRLYRYQM